MKAQPNSMQTDINKLALDLINSSAPRLLKNFKDAIDLKTNQSLSRTGSVVAPSRAPIIPPPKAPVQVETYRPPSPPRDTKDMLQSLYDRLKNLSLEDTAKVNS